MAQYLVVLKRRTPNSEDREKEYFYVSAPDTKAGYAKAVAKAKAKLEKAGKTGFHATECRCVG